MFPSIGFSITRQTQLDAPSFATRLSRAFFVLYVRLKRRFFEIDIARYA